MNTDYQNSKQYLRYMHELEHALNVLDNETKADILNELASHIYESMCMMPNTTLPEEERLSKVLNKLGNPTRIAQSYISEAQLKKSPDKRESFPNRQIRRHLYAPHREISDFGYPVLVRHNLPHIIDT